VRGEARPHARCIKHIREPEPLTRLASLAALDKLRRPLPSGESRSHPPCHSVIRGDACNCGPFRDFFGNLSMVIRARPIMPYLLASGGVATNVSRGGSGWHGRRLMPGGSLLEPPVSHPAPGVRGVAVRWFGQSGRSRREPSRRLSADPARAAVKLAGQAMIHLQSPDAGWDESPLFRRLPAWTVVPPRRSF